MLEASDRLQPLVVETDRGPVQLMRIFETLARVELTDGLTLPELIVETTSRMPRDATVVAILPAATTESAIALGNLRRQGFAVSVILNLYDEYEFAQASGPLLAEGKRADLQRDWCNSRMRWYVNGVRLYVKN